VAFYSSATERSVQFSFLLLLSTGIAEHKRKIKNQKSKIKNVGVLNKNTQKIFLKNM